MAVQILKAYANINTLWNVNNYTFITKAGDETGTPDTSTNIATDRNDDNENQQYICGATYLINVTQLVLWFYAATLDDRPLTLTTLATGVSGSAPATQNQALTSSVAQWFSKTFAYSAAAPGEIKYSFQPGSLGAADEIQIYAAHVWVTGTDPGPSPFIAFADI